MDMIDKDGLQLLSQTDPHAQFHSDLEHELEGLRTRFDMAIIAVRAAREEIKNSCSSLQNRNLGQIQDLLQFIDRLNVGRELECKVPIKQPSQLSQKTFNLLRLKEAIELKTPMYNDLMTLGSSDPTISLKLKEMSNKWNAVCEPLMEEYLTLKTASTEYGEFKTLAAQESDWLERLEKKIVKSANQAAADAEEISEELGNIQ